MAVAACVLFRDWCDEMITGQRRVVIASIEKYTPGQFYKRELPCILRVLEQIRVPLDIIILDGYVWLGDENRPGLGGYLYHILEEKIPIIGVAKNAFRGAKRAVEINRGKSRKPLYVTAAGIEVAVAARRIEQMHGPFRIPTMLRRADQLARAHAFSDLQQKPDR